ncbi:alpha/beta fold hydrolase [Nocardia alni]|uniref:alpha/beta fold hydrolase n=1 Tax=Nocardia alni TaxID=2815723 RepID=UPI001C24FA0A|nr:alpha/beta hydrolase [Nocardia alni]
MPFYETKDGTRLAYEDYGSGAPIVFLSGRGLTADQWEYQVPFLTDHGYRCIMPVRRGHGQSDRASTGYDPDTLADDTARLIEQLDLRDLTLVAHSVGGGEAVRYLRRHGDERVRGLLLLSATLPALQLTEDNPEGAPDAVMDETLALFDADYPKWFADRAQGYYATHLGNNVSPALIDNEIARLLSASKWATAHVALESFRADFREDVRAVQVPTLIIHGVADQSAPIDLCSRRTAELKPDAVYKEYPTAGHGLYVTHATELNDDILDFVER